MFPFFLFTVDFPLTSLSLKHPYAHPPKLHFSEVQDKQDSVPEQWKV